MRRVQAPALAALLLLLTVSSPAGAQGFRAHDSASGGADSLDRAADRARDEAAVGGGAVGRRETGSVEGEGFSENGAAATRTFDEDAGLGSPEGTLQDSGEVIGDILR